MQIRIIKQISIILGIAMLFMQQGYCCELMGYSFNETVQSRHIFSVFRYRELRHGWGTAYYPDKSVLLYKEPTKILSSKLATFLTTYEEYKAPLMMAHVRIATVGSVLYRNTHPFQRELAGKQYVFCHNGTLSNYQNGLKLGSIKPIGTTDSEHLFCYLLGQIEKESIEEWNSETCKWLESKFKRANDFGWMFCLFSNGEHLFAYRCDNYSDERLHYVKRKSPYGKIHFKGMNKTVDLSTIYPALSKGVIFASKPLSNESWTTVKKGKLIVVKGGEVVYP